MRPWVSSALTSGEPVGKAVGSLPDAIGLAEPAGIMPAKRSLLGICEC